MRLSEKIIAAVRDTFDTLLFFATMAVKEDFRNYIKGSEPAPMNPSRRLAILGNGPSLAQQLPDLIACHEWDKADMVAVNCFALSDEFELIRPKYYVISDPMFFR